MYMHINNYPYDIIKETGDKVKTIHITAWYDIHREDIIQGVKEYREEA